MDSPNKVPSEEEYKLLLAKRKAEEEKWAKIVDTMVNHAAVLHLYQKPGMRKILAIIDSAKLLLFYQQFASINVADFGAEVTLLPNSNYIDKSQIIEDGWREVGMQRLILESIALTFLANYPEDISGYNGTKRRQTRFRTSKGILVPDTEVNRWTESGEGNPVTLSPRFCAELDTLIDIKIGGDDFNRTINVTIADR